ncbi:MAG: low molecular weight protein arginine phosphatase [Acidobacteria bacterium]|nr:MAG: low molecular weight protein arginine phosphatase [Acidobacteriota bacterium]
MTILYLCTANICRSPVAEHYMRRVAERLGRHPVRCLSSGTHAVDGRPADPVVVELARERGLDLSRHRSRALTRDMLDQADEIVVMTRIQRAFLREHYPDVMGKVVLLREADGGLDLPDPIGGPVAEYRKVLEILFRCIEARALELSYPA